MEGKIFSLKPDGISTKIGNEFNTATDQLRFMMIISQPDIVFVQDDEHPTNVFTQKFENFRLTVLFSYLNVRSYRHSINITPYTRKEDCELISGLEWWQVYNLYTDINLFCARHHFEKY